MVQRYIVVNEEDNIIVNAILWDGVTPYTPPDGCFLVQNDTLDIGETYTP